MRRTFALLMFLVLASTPILDGGCFTYNQISSSRKEVWNDLRPPCAAFVGFDGSLTLVLPDGDDLVKAKFFAAKFSPEEVRAVATPVAKPVGTLWLGTPAAPLPPAQAIGPTVPLDPPNPPPAGAVPAREDSRLQVMALNSPFTRDQPPRGELRLSLSRRSSRLTSLTGSTQREWAAGLGQGYWLGSGAFEGFSSRYRQYSVIAFGVPQYLPDTWDMRFMEAGDVARACRIVREDGTRMVPTAGQFWVPVTLVADVVTSPIQLVFLIGAAVSK
jgi:hypothetical protein